MAGFPLPWIHQCNRLQYVPLKLTWVDLGLYAALKPTQGPILPNRIRRRASFFLWTLLDSK